MPRRGRPFEPGNQFGKGRPPGSRNKKAREAQELLLEYAVPLLRTTVAGALKGDVRLQQTLLPYILGRPQELPVNIGPLPTGTAAEVSKATETVVKKATSGKITLGQGQQLTDLLAGRRLAIESEDHEQRLRALESDHEPSNS